LSGVLRHKAKQPKCLIAGGALRIKSLADCYYYIGKIIGAFALQNVTALVWPVEAKIVHWKNECLDALTEGKTLRVFEA
jgi:hypothetical protein